MHMRLASSSSTTGHRRQFTVVDQVPHSVVVLCCHPSTGRVRESRCRRLDSILKHHCAFQIRERLRVRVQLITSLDHRCVSHVPPDYWRPLSALIRGIVHNTSLKGVNVEGVKKFRIKSFEHISDITFSNTPLIASSRGAFPTQSSPTIHSQKAPILLNRMDHTLTVSSYRDASTNDPNDHGDAFFAARAYRCKDDLIAAVVEYNHLHRRAYRVVTSDKRRYQARCADDQCAFVVRFAFMSTFKPPTLFHPHTCTGDLNSSAVSGVRVRVREPSSVPPAAGPSGADNTARTDANANANAAGYGDESVYHPADGISDTNSNNNSNTTVITNRACRAKHIARYPEVRALVAAHGDKTKTAWVRDVLAAHGLNATYANCFHARKRLLEDCKADPVRFAETTKNLAPLASFGFGSGSGVTTMTASVSSGGGGVNAVETMGVSAPVGGPNRGAPAATVATPAKKQRLESPAKQQQTPTEEPQGCCFICPSVSIASSSSTTAASTPKHQILQWQVRDQTSVKTFFDLYDDNRRIEILKSGTYRLHLYFESQGTQDEASMENGDENDGAKYYLMVNNKPLSVFKDEEADDDAATEASQAATRDDVPLGVFNVAYVQLKKWDMIVLRHTRGTESSANNNSEVQTPFGRFIIELVQ